MLKRLLLALLIFSVVIVIFRGALYRAAVTYQSVGQRLSYKITNENLIQYIEENTKEVTQIEDIIRESLSLTSKKLSFSFAKASNDPNQLIETGVANCIGYSTMFCSVCNYLIAQNDLLEHWEASAHIGQLNVFGVNIHSYLNSPFFKDHDYVVIENKQTKEKFAVDPSVNDYLRIGYIRLGGKSKSLRVKSAI
ncbi:hypothetical protein [Bacteroides sp. 224]|uniref:hypothetical protein n=1 Tax=Bacteroides sp. 224 TaxID=2302936 RepID=UPI0013D428F1|nr:hypothetical protein [Bacteroides sp. 224]NDV66699.1 hypothetical protein [Bacteroides sp. 224]